MLVFVLPLRQFAEFEFLQTEKNLSSVFESLLEILSYEIFVGNTGKYKGDGSRRFGRGRFSWLFLYDPNSNFITFGEYSIPNRGQVLWVKAFGKVTHILDDMN